MDCHSEKSSLPFSIDNILRDDFSQRRPRSIPSIPSNQSSFERCPVAPIYRYCAVRYCPVVMHFLPSLHRVGARLNRSNYAEKRLLFQEQPKDTEEACLKCEDDEPPLSQGEGKYLIIDFKKFTDNINKKTILSDKRDIHRVKTF